MTSELQDQFFSRAIVVDLFNDAANIVDIEGAEMDILKHSRPTQVVEMDLRKKARRPKFSPAEEPRRFVSSWVIQDLKPDHVHRANSFHYDAFQTSVLSRT